MTLRKREGCLFFWIVLSCVIQTSCTDPQMEKNVPQATIHLEKIIYKESREPLKNNTITLKWETLEGEIIKTELYEDRDSFSIALPADGSVRLFIPVDAPGYRTWGNALRMNWANDRPVYITVEMELDEGSQG